jgi:hypothetical protein
MSVFSGPEINSSGLIFHYDVNSSKSFVGAPVTNSQWNNGSEFAPWTVSGTNTDVSNTSEAGPIKGMKTWKFVKDGTSNQWNGWEAAYGSPFIWTGSSGDIWTTSYWYKTTSPAAQTVLNSGPFVLSDWSRVYNTTLLSSRTSIIADGQWHWNYTITQFNEAYTNAIIADGPSWGYSTSAGTLYINGLQWNKNAYATPISALGTRTTANCVYDMTRTSNLTATSLTYAYDGASPVPVTFNGTSDYITGTDLGDLNTFTCEAWVNLTTLPLGYACYVTNVYPGTTSKVNFALGHLVGTSSVYLGFYDGSWHYSPGYTISTNTWYNVVGTYNGSTLNLYVNGVSQGTPTSYAGTPTSSTGGIRIGRRWDAADYITGQIPVVKIYNRPLTPQEVKQNFNAMRGRFGI